MAVRFTAEARRRRIGRAHRLAPSYRSEDPVATANSVLALHATDPATVFLSVAARGEEVTPKAIEAVLYETQELVRMMGMRRTLFVVDAGFAGTIQAAVADDVARRMEKRVASFVEGGGLAAEGHAWLSQVEDAVVGVLSAGPATGAQIARRVPALSAKVTVGEGRRWEQSTAATSQVLAYLGAKGVLARGRPTGSWNSSRYEWRLATPLEKPAPPEARAALARRWLECFGPAALADLCWWTGWSQGVARAALSECDVVEVELTGGPGLALAQALDDAAGDEPAAALLPALDATTMGWLERDWYLGDHADRLFDRSGNAGPTVWWNGRVVGGWGQRRDGAVVYALFEDIGTEAAGTVGLEAERIERFLGPVRVIPRFRTPTEKSLTN